MKDFDHLKVSQEDLVHFIMWTNKAEYLCFRILHPVLLPLIVRSMVLRNCIGYFKKICHPLPVQNCMLVLWVANRDERKIEA